MRYLLAAALCACTSPASPLARVVPQIEIDSNPGGIAGQAYLEVTLTTWNDLDVLADAAIVVTLDATPLDVDPVRTGYMDERDSYVAAFTLAPPRSATAPAASSQLSVGDGETTWSVEIDSLFANDLARSGASAFVWPSATGGSTIDWACVEVGDQASACGGNDVDAPRLEVSQQVITTSLVGAAGTPVIVTAQRSVDPQSSGDGPVLFARIVDQLVARL